MSNILQEIRGRLNSALNTVTTPPVAPVGGISPVISIGSFASDAPCYRQGNTLRTSVVAPAAGASLGQTPALDAGCYDFDFYLSADLQAAVRTYQLIVQDSAGVNKTFLDATRVPANEWINQRYTFALVLDQGDRVRLHNDVLGTGTWISSIKWQKRIINP